MNDVVDIFVLSEIAHITPNEALRLEGFISRCANSDQYVSRADVADIVIELVAIYGINIDKIIKSPYSYIIDLCNGASKDEYLKYFALSN